MNQTLFYLVGLLLFNIAQCYNNGEGYLPALGWNTWCSVGNCGTDICSEKQIKETAMAMKSNGMYDAGYTHINLDDCWTGCDRLSNGSITWDSSRFPNGIPALTEYLHSLGLTFGLYTSAGTHTCSSGTRPFCNPPGSYGHYSEDAQSFAWWNVDYVKLDWCGSELNNAKEQQTQFSQALNATGRHMWLELCRGYGYPPPTWVADVSNSWRVTGDHQDHWYSTQSAIDAVSNQTYFSGSYNWAYNDFLMTGGQGCINEIDTNVSTHCPGQTNEEYKTEFSIWALSGSPLIVATDIRNMSAIMNQVLLNKEIIAVNQLTTTAGSIIESSVTDCDGDGTNACSIWSRPLTNDNSQYAVIMLNLGSKTNKMAFNFGTINSKFNTNTQFKIRDLWTHTDNGTATGSFSSNVPSHGVQFITLK